MARKTQPVLGVLMLTTRFPRPTGDVGNPATWPCRALFRVVEPARVDAVVTGDPLPEALVAAFISAGRELVAAGATLITTSCGFLVTVQAALEAALPAPVVTSALLQIPAIQADLPLGRRVGVITFDARRLTPAHLAAAGAPADTPLAGLERGDELYRVISQDLQVLDPGAAEADLLAAGRALQTACPALGAVVLECTNLPPYGAALAAEFRLPVYDLVTFLAPRLDAAGNLK